MLSIYVDINDLLIAIDAHSQLYILTLYHIRDLADFGLVISNYLTVKNSSNILYKIVLNLFFLTFREPGKILLSGF